MRLMRLFQMISFLKSIGPTRIILNSVINLFDNLPIVFVNREIIDFPKKLIVVNYIQSINLHAL